MTVILSRLDLSDDENLRECRHEVNRILDMSDLMQRMGAWALWGAKWGEAALEELETPSRRSAEFLEAIEKAVSDMDDAAEMKTSKQSLDAYLKIATDLEAVLAQ